MVSLCPSTGNRFADPPYLLSIFMRLYSRRLGRSGRSPRLPLLPRNLPLSLGGKPESSTRSIHARSRIPTGWHRRFSRHDLPPGTLEDLGVDAVWITACFDSPNADNGYDVRDYRRIHPDFGTMDDFDRFMAEAKKHNIRVILDMVFNHSSDEHEWFKQSRSSRDQSIPGFLFLEGRRRRKARPTTGLPSSAAPDGSSTRPPASITCIIMPSSSPISTGRIRRSGRSFMRF